MPNSFLTRADKWSGGRAHSRRYPPAHTLMPTARFWFPPKSDDFALSPAEFVQSVFFDAEVVRDLVDDGHGDLVNNLVLGCADVEYRIAENSDRVRQVPTVMRIPLGQSDALIQTEQPRFFLVTCFDKHHDIVDCLGKFGRNQIERLADQFLEPVGRHSHRHGLRRRSCAGQRRRQRPTLRCSGWRDRSGAVDQDIALGASGDRGKPPVSTSLPIEQLTRRLPANQLSSEMLSQNSVSVLSRSASAEPRYSLDA